MGSCAGKDEKQKSPRTGRMIVRSQVDTTQFIRLDSNFQTDIRKHYKFLRVLGHGHFGTVRLAVPYLQNQQVGVHKFAIKTIPKNKISSMNQAMRRELSILKSADHPNIINLSEVFEDELSVHLVMEYCNGGDLFEHLLKHGTFSENRAGQIVDQVLSGLSYLHNNSIVHRDLKPENIIFANKSEDAQIKIIDFGLSNKFGVSSLHTVVGTPYYVAPEVLGKDYGKECDIWSLGVILYIMLSGRPPFEGANPQQVFKKIREANLAFDADAWVDISFEAKSLIRQMLVKNPRRRINIREILRHRWYQQNKERRAVKAAQQVIGNIKNIKAPTKFKQVAMKVLIKNLEIDQIYDLTQAFSLLDVNKTGFVNIQDFKKVLQDYNLQIAEQEINKFIKKFEWIKDGKINYSDFIIATVDQKKILDEEKLYEAFKHFDVDNTGYITKQNLQAVLENQGVTPLFDEWMSCFTEEINFEEFKRLMLEGLSNQSPVARKTPATFNQYVG